MPVRKYPKRWQAFNERIIRTIQRYRASARNGFDGTFVAERDRDPLARRHPTFVIDNRVYEEKGEVAAPL